MDGPTLAKLQALRSEAGELRNALDAFARRLDTLMAEQAPNEGAAPGPDDWKRDDGRLSDQGVLAMEAMFEAGRSVTDTSKDFGITVSAASNRKRIWQAKTAR